MMGGRAAYMKLEINTTNEQGTETDPNRSSETVELQHFLICPEKSGIICLISAILIS